MSDAAPLLALRAAQRVFLRECGWGRSSKGHVEPETGRALCLQHAVNAQRAYREVQNTPALEAAEDAYLAASGYTKHPLGRDVWSQPDRKGRYVWWRPRKKALNAAQAMDGIWLARVMPGWLKQERDEELALPGVP